MESFRVASWSMRYVRAQMTGRTRFPGALRKALALGWPIEFVGTATDKPTTLAELAAAGTKSIIVRHTEDRETMALPTRQAD